MYISNEWKAIDDYKEPRYNTMELYIYKERKVAGAWKESRYKKTSYVAAKF
jgi:hypothetical protein